VIVAVAILATAGLAIVEVASESARAVRQASVLEKEVADEERLIAAHSLLAKTDLDRRLGMRDVGRYVVTVERPEHALYRIALRRKESPEVEDLVTVVYRPKVHDAQ
jgi:hypothetical protein